MNNWVVFVTIWIILQTGFKAAKEPSIAALKGQSIHQAMGSIFGHVMWGAAMLFSLYMAGLYT